MRPIILAIVANCLVFAGVGLGPMALLAPRLGLLAVLALAPVAGYALYSMGLTCWVLQDGTAGSAAWPLALGLFAVSAACLGWAWPSVRARLPAVSGRRAVAGLLGLTLCLGLLVAPLAAGSKGYGVFRGNAADSFIYMFLARYFDEHPRTWGFARSEADINAADPVLAPARAMLNIRWTSGAMLTACARLGGLGILDFQYPFTLVSYVLFFAALLPFLTAMGLAATAATVSALALTTGFYGQLVLDIRAFSQVNTLSLVVLLAYVLSLPPPAKRSGALRRVVLLGLCYLATFVNYTEIFPMIFGAAAAFLTAKAMLSRLTLRETGIQVAAFALFYFKNAPWVAGKGLSYFYPATASLVLYAALARPAGRPQLSRVAAGLATTLAVVFLLSQLLAAGMRPAYASLEIDYPRYVQNHGRYRTIDCELAPIQAGLAKAKAKKVAICSADSWKWSFLGLSLDGPYQVALPDALLAGPAEEPVFVILDRPVTGAPPELAPYVAGENATFALYRMPKSVLDRLVPTLTCKTNPY